MKRNSEIQYESERDVATRLIAEQYRSKGYGLHFHRNLEIYGVVDGEVTVTVAGDRKVCRGGDIAILNCMERHEYSITDDAEIYYLHIGTRYLSVFNSLYKNAHLPHFLCDAERNHPMNRMISGIIGNPLTSELKKHGFVSTLLGEIVDGYGVVENASIGSAELIERIVQYIYDHYAEDITLKTLADEFCMTPKSLSKKLSQCIGVDLRLFVSDIRLQKAMQMMENPATSDLPKKDIAHRCGIKSMRSFYRAYERSKDTYYKETD